MNLVLDTNVYCDYAEGLPATVDLLAEYGDSKAVDQIESTIIES